MGDEKEVDVPTMGMLDEENFRKWSKRYMEEILLNDNDFFQRMTEKREQLSEKTGNDNLPISSHSLSKSSNT